VGGESSTHREAAARAQRHPSKALLTRPRCGGRLRLSTTISDPGASSGLRPDDDGRVVPGVTPGV